MRRLCTLSVTWVFNKRSQQRDVHTLGHSNRWARRRCMVGTEQSGRTKMLLDGQPSGTIGNCSLRRRCEHHLDLQFETDEWTGNKQ